MTVTVQQFAGRRKYRSTALHSHREIDHFHLLTEHLPALKEHGRVHYRRLDELVDHHRQFHLNLLRHTAVSVAVKRAYGYK